MRVRAPDGPSAPLPVVARFAPSRAVAARSVSAIAPTQSAQACEPPKWEPSSRAPLAVAFAISGAAHVLLLFGGALWQALPRREAPRVEKQEVIYFPAMTPDAARAAEAGSSGAEESVSLAELVADHLPAMPQDPFGLEPFQLARVELQPAGKARIELERSMPSVRPVVMPELPTAIPGVRGAVYEVSDVDRPPIPVLQLSPRVSAEKRREIKDGFVVLRFVVTADAGVVNIRVVRSSHRALEQPTVNALASWQFLAGRKNGRKVNTWVEQEFRFRSSSPFQL